MAGVLPAKSVDLGHMTRPNINSFNQDFLDTIIICKYSQKSIYL